MLRIRLVLSLLICSVISAFGQDALDKNKTESYCIEGMIIDSTSKKVISDISIQIFYSGNDIASTFTKSDTNGFFKICPYRKVQFLKITQMGYNELRIDIPITADSNIQLGNIPLKKTIATFEGATVKFKKEEEPITIDKKTYSVSQNILATGGTAIDALKQIPAINVDNDGNISLRGSNNITVYINGKQSSLSGADRQALLLQIPAANIESIEVNTNPGAKQDAEGQSGIINITLKHNTSKNKNGYVTLGAGTRNKYNGTLSLNTNYKKFIFSNTLSFRQNDQWGRGYNLRTNYFNNTSNQVNQSNSGTYLNYNYAFSGNIDYNINKKLTLSTNYLFSKNINNDEELSRTELRDESDSLYQILERRNEFTNTSDNIDVGLTLRKTFNKPSHNLITMVNYSNTFVNNNTDINQNELNTQTDQIKSLQPYLLYLSNQNRYQNKLLQIDYTRPLPGNIKMETGLKYTGRNLDNNFIADSFDHQKQEIVVDNGKSNHFIYDENISAAYGMITHTINPILKYNVGLRMENTAINGAQLSTDTNFKYNYTNLFPSGNINFTLQKQFNLPDFQLSYSKRINRPSQGQLNPFISYTDPFNLSRGNPNLQPELTHALEISAIYNTKKIVFTATAYGRQTNQPISRYRTIDSNQISMVTQVNLDYNRSIGSELIVRFSPVKDLRITLNGNIYRYTVSGNVVGNDFVNNRISYSGKANVTYQFWKKTDVQANFNYMGPFVTPQGLIKPMFGLEIGGKKDLIKEKLSISVNIADVFDNRRFQMEMSDPTFTSKFYRKRESRILTINLTWKFGNSDTKAVERKPRQQEQTAPMDF